MCRWAESDPDTDPLIVVAYGTSLTADGWWLAEVSEALDTRYPRSAVYLNAAQSARDSAWGLENLDARVLSQTPDILFLEFAVNDAYLPYGTDVPGSIARLDALIERIEAADPNTDVIVIVTNFVVGAGATVRPDLPLYYAAWREDAASRGLLVVDEEPAWQMLYEMSPATFEALVPDGLHPNAAGHRLMNGPLILDALDGRESDLVGLVSHAIDAVPLP